MTVVADDFDALGPPLSRASSSGNAHQAKLLAAFFLIYFVWVVAIVTRRKA